MADSGIDNSPIKRVVQVDSSGTPFYAGASAVNSQKNEDAAHSSGDTGTFVLGVRNDTAAARTNADTDYTPFSVDSRGAQFTNPSSFTYKAVTAADAQVKAAAGFLHCITFSCNDAAPTAGSIIVYDSLTEANTQIFNHTFTTTPFVPFTVFFDCVFATGLYLGFTTTNDVNVSVSYL